MQILLKGTVKGVPEVWRATGQNNIEAAHEKRRIHSTLLRHRYAFVSDRKFGCFSDTSPLTSVETFVLSVFVRRFNGRTVYDETKKVLGVQPSLEMQFVIMNTTDTFLRINLHEMGGVQYSYRGRLNLVANLSSMEQKQELSLP